MPRMSEKLDMLNSPSALLHNAQILESQTSKSVKSNWGADIILRRCKLKLPELLISICISMQTNSDPVEWERNAQKLVSLILRSELL